jgi:hypothetical protein
MEMENGNGMSHEQKVKTQRGDFVKQITPVIYTLCTRS